MYPHSRARIVSTLMMIVALASNVGESSEAPASGWTATDASGTKFPLKLSTRQTWLSQRQPEWHVLLENPTDEPIRFEIDRSPDWYRSFNKCLRAHGSREDVIDRQPVRGDEQTSRWGGEVPPRGWSHRVVVLGGWQFAAGCSLMFEVTAVRADEARVSKKLAVTLGMPPSRSEQPAVGYSNRNLKKAPRVEHSVELRGWSKRTLPDIYTLVRNEGHEILDVQVVLGGFECREGVHAWLPAARDVRYPDRLYSGPVRLRPGEWMAFRRSFSKSPADGSKTCWAKMIVEASNLDHSASSEHVAEVRF